MANFIPSLEKIRQFRVPPTEGEWYLLRFLQSTLDDNYEIYFNPYLNGDRPDVIIMRKGGGVMIIEVKDWNLELYELDEKKHWHLKHPQDEAERCAYLKSPIKQVNRYKENLYNLHVETLLEQKIKNPKLWEVVACGVYFHNALQSKILNLVVNPYREQEGYIKEINRFELIGRDNLNATFFNKMLARHYMDGARSYYFSDDLYNRIHRLLQPPLFQLSQGEIMLRYDGRNKNHVSKMYSKKQDELIFDESKRKEWRVKGVVGSGKTTLLAGKAVQAYKELAERGIERPKILILTYNITLRNFIGDMINSLGGDKRAFTILHYHGFIKSQLNNLGVEVKYEEGDTVETVNERKYDSYELFQGLEDKTERFDVVFIDEIQDFKRVWMDIVKDFFLYKGGEYPQGGYYLLGDVKQNIYDRSVENEDVPTNVRGKANALKTCFRSDMKIKDLSVGFQKIYFLNKYELDLTLMDKDDEELFEGLEMKQGYLNYMYLCGENYIQSVFNIIEGNIERRISNESINDITVLGADISFLQLFDAYYRHKTGRKSSTMFETYEIRFLLAMQSGNLDPNFMRELVFLLKCEGDKTTDRVMRYVANLLTCYELYTRFPSTFGLRLQSQCNMYKCDMRDFLALMQRYGVEVKRIVNLVLHGNRKLNEKYDQVCEVKKYNFYMNSGTIKISTIHSFKGWESNTVFLILRPKDNDSTSFDELLYTGITRTRSNLVVINLGNKEYDENIRDLIEKYK